jgi:hypothetical protein
MEPLFHLFIPILILLAFFPKLEKKYIFGLAFFTILMDFDIFLTGWHRVLMNNFLFIFIVSGMVYFVWDKKAYFVSLFYLSSHLIFDMSYPGGAIFFPFSTKLYSIIAEIYKQGDFIFNLGIETITREEFIQLALEPHKSYWISIEGFLLSLVIVLALTFKFRKDIKQTFSK